MGSMMSNVTGPTGSIGPTGFTGPTGTAGITTVEYNAGGSGAIDRSINDKLKDIINVTDFGAVGDGLTDDTQAFIDAMNFIGTGTIYFNKKHLIDSNLTVPPAITLKGAYEFPGIATHNLMAPYGNMSALIINPTATIYLGGGSGITGALLYRKGMIFPENDATAFSGTAVTAQGDDCFLNHCMVLGFNKVYYSTGFQRPILHTVKFDCIHGIDIHACFDVGYITECHGWPFAVIGSGSSQFKRSGTAYHFSNGFDWGKVTNCFSYAYLVGLWIHSCGAMTVTGCGFDSTGNYPGQLGVFIDGTSQDNRFTLCQAAAQESGYVLNTSAGFNTHFLNCDSWACTDNGMVIMSGDVVVVGGIHRNTTTGIAITNSTSHVSVDDVTFSGLTYLPFNVMAPNTNIHIGNNHYGNHANGVPVIGNNKLIKSIPSAEPLLIPSDSILMVTGNNNISTINGGYAGRQLTLLFNGNLTIIDGAIRLKGNFVTSMDSTLSLIHNGIYWIETSRSIN